ncbi:MAG: putative 2OG-Fe(II) oxygenase [Gammaproteobacteria bacterium]|jgi:uncharacterized protein (TIGR02466 family)
MTNPEFRVYPWFTTPVGEFRFPDADPLCDSLKRLFLEREKEGDRYRYEFRRDTQHGELFESRFDLFHWPEEPVRQLAGMCHRALCSVVAEVNGYGGDEMDQLSFQYHAWFHITRKGGSQGLHNHANAAWSGIFCVDPGDQVPEHPASGMVRFLDPRGMAFMYADPSNEHLKPPYNRGGYDVAHEAGKLIIFPSYLFHEIFPYQGERPRIVVAFNAIAHKRKRDIKQ